MRNIFLLSVLLSLCFCEINWKLDIKAEVEGSAIVLVPGVYTKINLELNTDAEINFNDESSFTIALSDDTVTMLNGEVKITPTESLVYEAYIGIKCASDVSGTNKDLKFTLKSSDGKDKITLPTVQVQISKAKTKIDLGLAMDEMPGSSYNLFKLAKDIRNIEPLTILPKFEGEEDLLEFTSIVLKAFGQRDEISADNAYNHGVLFDFPFGTKKTFEELKDKASLLFNLNLETSGMAQCFEFAKANFDLKIKKEGPVSLDANVKQAIIYNTDDGSQKFDFTNSIQINTVIPIAPVLLSCEVRVDTQFTNNQDTLTSTNEEGVLHYKTLIDTAGHVSFKLDGLSADTEYYTKCTVSNTNFVENLREKIAVTIGNFQDADVIKQLLPSRNENRIPQCLKLKFNNYVQSALFEQFGTKYCKWVMSKGEPLLAKLLGTVVCQFTDKSSLTNPVNTLCVSPSPLYNIGKFITNSKEDKYNENLETLISKLKKAGETFANMGLKGVEVSVINRYYDNDPIDINKVQLTLTGLSLTKTFTFDVVSTNEQPIQCFYNKVMTNERTKFLNFIQDSVILEPQKKQQITAQIGGVTSGLYSLSFKCVNLPGFVFKFESTDTEIMYTYYLESLFTGVQEIPAHKPITINCDENKNKLNPRCLKKKVLFLVDKLRTEIPAVIAEIQAKAEKFTHVTKEAQKTILSTIKKNLDSALAQKDKLKNLLERAIEMAKYLTYTDCSIYVDGSTNEEEKTVKAGAYVECRQMKKDYLKKIMEFLNSNFQCAMLLQTLVAPTTEEMTIEEKMKYILLLINEITNNPDAFEENASETLYQVVDCLQNEFEKYWTKVSEFLEKEKGYLKESVAAVKRDAENIILQTLTNLVNALHFDEIDGFIDKTKEKITEKGMMIYDKGLELQKKIIEWAKKLTEFGNNTYQLGLTAAVNVAINNGLTADADAELSIFDLEDKGIKIITNTNFMLRDKNAHAMQTLVFESPLFSVKAEGEEDATPQSLSTFVSITLYDKDGKEIKVEDIAKKFKPQILYLKSRYQQLKSCFYFNEETNELEDSGVDYTKEFIYNGQKYFKCVTEHLTSFTASDYSSGLPWYVILLIVLGAILVIGGGAIAFLMLRKKAAANAEKTQVSGDTINKELGQEEALVS